MLRFTDILNKNNVNISSLCYKAAPNVKFEIIDEMIKNDKNLLKINMLCEIAGVSRSGFYDWRKAKRNHTTRDDSDRADLDLILWAYNFRGV